MTTLLSAKCLGLTLMAITSVTTGASGQNPSLPSMTLPVDATEAPRRIAFVHEEIRVRPGALALAYPSWIPGEHGPTGPIQQVAALRIHSGNAMLAWTRGPEDIYTIHVEVPPGTDRITVDFDTLVVNTISDHQPLFAWNTTVLYPRNIDKRELMVAPSILLPANWKQGSIPACCQSERFSGEFCSGSLERLIDSPVLAGEFFRTVPLASDWPAELGITGDSQAAVDTADDAHAFTLFTKLVEQDRAMFGFRQKPARVPSTIPIYSFSPSYTTAGWFRSLVVRF